jgi:hypothetical protein
MWLTGTRRQRIWVAQHRVDFRKAHGGLLAEAYKMSLDPYNGDVVIFIGRNRRRIKVLHADQTGLWISSKLFTMEAMKTRFQFLLEPSCKVISQGELALLLEGSRYTIEKSIAAYSKPIDEKEGDGKNFAPS